MTPSRARDCQLEQLGRSYAPQVSDWPIENAIKVASNCETKLNGVSVRYNRLHPSVHYVSSLAT